MDPLFEFALMVKAVQRELERVMNEAMRPHGITAAQADALLVVSQAEPLALKDLGGLLIAEAGHPSRLVDRLVEAGLLSRRPAAGDRRRVELSLTPAGRRASRRAARAREEVLAAGHELLGRHDLTPTLRLLRELVDQTAYAELVARRRELFERAAGGR